MVRVACCGARREIVPVTYLSASGLGRELEGDSERPGSRACIVCIEISIWNNKSL
jgi:hypothetical protein